MIADTDATSSATRRTGGGAPGNFSPAFRYRQEHVTFHGHAVTDTSADMLSGWSRARSHTTDRISYLSPRDVRKTPTFPSFQTKFQSYPARCAPTSNVSAGDPSLFPRSRFGARTCALSLEMGSIPLLKIPTKYSATGVCDIIHRDLLLSQVNLLPSWAKK